MQFEVIQFLSTTQAILPGEN